VLDTGDFVVFELRGALQALFGVEDLGRDAHAEPERPSGGIRSSIIITVDRADDVDEVIRRAHAAGALARRRRWPGNSSRAVTPTSLTPRATSGSCVVGQRQPGYGRRPSRRRL